MGLGFDVTAYRDAGGGAHGEIVLSWGDFYLEWADALMTGGRPVVAEGDGYPFRYYAPAGVFRETLFLYAEQETEGAPETWPRRGRPLSDERYLGKHGPLILTPGQVKALRALKSDEPLVIEAWDQS